MTFFDPSRAVAGLGTRTGDVNTEAGGVGLYGTFYGATGSYIDLAGHVLHYHNTYRDQLSIQGTQSGWGGVWSLEVGTPIALGKTHWHLEPQGQLFYQHLHLQHFADSVSDVSDVRDNAVRGRIGMHVFRTPGPWLGFSRATPYALVNVYHDFTNPGAVTIGGTEFRERLSRNTWDIGAGIAAQVRDNMHFFSDVCYQNSFDGKNNGWLANIGIRVSLW